MAIDDASRRNFVKQASAIGILGLLAGGGMIGLGALEAKELPLRPPAAVKEEDFLALCVKCGQCLQVCPYHSIKLADMALGHGVGTPYIDPRERGCYLCELLPCVLACPSGALDHHVEDVGQANMGIAVVVRVNDCIATKNEPVKRDAIDRIYFNTATITYEELRDKKLVDIPNKPEKRELEEKILKNLETFEGKQCTICADMCPLPNKEQAIHMVANSSGGQKPEILAACVGCGACVELCPTNVLEIEARLNYDEYYKQGKRNG